MILGIDVGYSHTKTIGENICFKFKSTVEEGALDIGNALVVEYDGKTYTIGEENGLYATEI
ncbi:StbA family protein, partial [Clostridium perfringens]|nr:StbA family protein [Clostridium perfringens]